MFGIDFPDFSGGNPYVGQTAYSSIDTFNTALENNGALQPLGTIYQAPLNPDSIVTAGIGANVYLKYVRYNPTVTQVLKNGPMLMYWKDNTFTTVTGLASEAYEGINNIAGWMLYNTTAVTGATAAQVNGNFIWLFVGGFLPGAWVTAATAGDSIYGAASTFGATGHTAESTAPTNRVAGWALTTAASNLADLNVPLLN